MTAVTSDRRLALPRREPADIAGDFPGSPVRLAFGFRFTDDGRIAELTIRP